jgi:hypothetical protein
VHFCIRAFSCPSQRVAAVSLYVPNPGRHDLL